jgi:hypothetical protein
MNTRYLALGISLAATLALTVLVSAMQSYRSSNKVSALLQRRAVKRVLKGRARQQSLAQASPFSQNIPESVAQVNHKSGASSRCDTPPHVWGPWIMQACTCINAARTHCVSTYFQTVHFCIALLDACCDFVPRPNSEWLQALPICAARYSIRAA